MHGSLEGELMSGRGTASLETLAGFSHPGPLRWVPS